MTGKGFGRRICPVNPFCGAFLGAALTLTGCGSDGGSTPTPPPVNQAPIFTSAPAISVAENMAATFYTVAANDPEGGTVTYSIGGGADASKFVLSGNQLRFAAPPDFDLPGDADGDNIYLVRVIASDGSASATLDLQVTVTNDKEGVAVRRIAAGFVDPIAIAAIPGDTRMFVAERGGRIYLLDPATGQKTLFQTLSPSTDGERGLKAIAVSPRYATDGRYFVLMSGSDGRITLYGCTRSGTFLSPECNDFVAGEVHGQTNDYGAFMGYGPDGKLYVATGDAGGRSDPAGSAQRDGSILGKLLRVDNNPDPYAGASPQFFIATTVAKGFHNPRGGTFLNGALLLGDRGESVREEIDLVALTGGGNYGWPAKEGTAVIGAAVPAGVIDPVIEYPYMAGGGVVGGQVYRGPIASLRDRYIFADGAGAIYAVPVSLIAAGTTLGRAALERRTEDFAPDAGTLKAPVAFAQDNNGAMFIVDAGGDIFRVDGG